jgi:uncharacterized protein YbbK (DUF523 family)
VNDRVVTESGEDVTAAFVSGAEHALRLAKENDVAFAVMKDGSPSCGVNAIYDGSFSERKTPGRGVASDLLVSSGYRVFSEDELEFAEALLSSLGDPAPL